jgi:hypothetical protein
MSGLTDNIQNAIDRFEYNLSSMSFEDAFDQLSQEIFNIRLSNVRKMIAEGVAPTKQEGELVKAVQSEFDEMHKMYEKLKKSGRLGDITPNKNFGEQLLDTVKKKKTVIGEVVRMLPKDQKE